jgi:hypothetical protein
MLVSEICRGTVRVAPGGTLENRAMRRVPCVACPIELRLVSVPDPKGVGLKPDSFEYAPPAVVLSTSASPTGRNALAKPSLKETVNVSSGSTQFL